MKKAAIVLALMVLLAGCFPKSDLDRGMELRNKILDADRCSFQVEVTADYGDKLFTCGMDCKGDDRGAVAFTVTEPESISGISGSLSAEGGRLTFDDQALAFPLLADGLLSPVSAPWVLLKTLRGGCITTASTQGDLLHLTMDDSYSDDALHLDIWLDQENSPVRGEVLWRGQRYLTMDVKNFRME